jgi:hypothetical protein
MSPAYQRHREATADISASPEDVLAFLDDQRRLSKHMEKPSLMMAGATMKIETDSQRGQAVGSLIGMTGSFLGIALCVDETVSEYKPPFWKSMGDKVRIDALLLPVTQSPDAVSVSSLVDALHGASSLDVNAERLELVHEPNDQVWLAVAEKHISSSFGQRKCVAFPQVAQQANKPQQCR